MQRRYSLRRLRCGPMRPVLRLSGISHPAVAVAHDACHREVSSFLAGLFFFSETIPSPGRWSWESRRRWRAVAMDEIQKIVFEIADRCGRRRIPVNDMLAAFVAKTVILESPERFQLDRPLQAQDVEELVGLAVERLSKEDDPALETLRMQVAFDAAYVQRQEALEKERAAAKRSYSVIEQSICALKLASTKDVGGMGQMHRLIIAALLTKTGQNTQNEVYQKEVAAALESVLPRANLHAFTSLAYSDKRDRLADLHFYVLGIRLFNKALGKGGTGLPDKIAEAKAVTRQLSESVAEG